MASAPAPLRCLRFRKTVGLVSIAVGSLWTLLWVAAWYAVWALTGVGGVVALALDWRFFTRNLVDDSCPTWSPDERRIAFDRIDYERDRAAIVVVDLTTGAETEIARSDGDFVSEPAWQPTGIEGAWPSRLHRVVGSS